MAFFINCLNEQRRRGERSCWSCHFQAMEVWTWNNKTETCKTVTWQLYSMYSRKGNISTNTVEEDMLRKSEKIVFFYLIYLVLTTVKLGSIFHLAPSMTAFCKTSKPCLPDLQEEVNGSSYWCVCKNMLGLAVNTFCSKLLGAFARFVSEDHDWMNFAQCNFSDLVV